MPTGKIKERYVYLKRTSSSSHDLFFNVCEVRKAGVRHVSIHCLAYIGPCLIVL